jgi:hypothetical protein
MTRSLLVANAHGLDLLTFLMVLSLFGIAGESNGVMQTVYASGGILAVVALKASGTAALAFLTQLRRWALLPAAGAGLLGASVNLLAIGVIR